MGSLKKQTQQQQNNTQSGRKKSSAASGLEALVLVNQLGLTIAIPIVMGAAAGRWIDDKLGTGIVFTLILICLGIAGGVLGAYRLVAAVQKKTNRK